MKAEELDQLASALVKAQAEMPVVAKDSTNPFFKSKYADLASIVRTATPIISKHGLSISQFVSHHEGHSTLKTYLLHTSGQHLVEEMPLLLPKEDPQGQGSAITYARRYSYSSVLGLVTDEDDDGQAASRPQKAPAPVQATLDDAKMGKLRHQLQEAGFTGKSALDYCLTVIGKVKPETDDDLDKLLASFEVKS